MAKNSGVAGGKKSSKNTTTDVKPIDTNPAPKDALAASLKSKRKQWWNKSLFGISIGNLILLLSLLCLGYFLISEKHIKKLLTSRTILTSVPNFITEVKSSTKNQSYSDSSNQCTAYSESGECISSNANFENSEDVLSNDDNDVTMLETVEGEELVDIGTSVVVPKGANLEGRPREAVKDCVDRYPNDCGGFVAQGECDRNPGWMIINCAKSCNVCHLRDPTVRCSKKTLNMTEEPIYRPGDMESMFESLQSRFGHLYDINVLSRSPWVVTFDNFLAPEEAKALITTVKKWERSTDSGLTNEFGETGRILSSGRTSSNSWCTGECEDHPDVKKILHKIETITGVPRGNYESFQVLKYEIGQKYNVHHDYGAEDVKLACGPRILTFFFYLSDVEEGGETAFPSLNIAVKPKRGRALLWPSTLSDFPESQDARTFHEARPVIKGTKFAANSWIHMYDYEIPNLWGCTGSFDEL